MRKVSSGICGKESPRSTCKSEQSDLHCPLTESFDTTDCMNGEQRPGWYFAHAHDDLICALCAWLKTRFRLMRAICSSLSVRSLLQGKQIKKKISDLLLYPFRMYRHFYLSGFCIHCNIYLNKILFTLNVLVCLFVISSSFRASGRLLAS